MQHAGRQTIGLAARRSGSSPDDRVNAASSVLSRLRHPADRHTGDRSCTPTRACNRPCPSRTSASPHRVIRRRPGHDAGHAARRGAAQPACPCPAAGGGHGRRAGPAGRACGADRTGRAALAAALRGRREGAHAALRAGRRQGALCRRTGGRGRGAGPLHRRRRARPAARRLRGLAGGGGHRSRLRCWRRRAARGRGQQRRQRPQLLLWRPRRRLRRGRPSRRADGALPAQQLHAHRRRCRHRRMPGRRRGL